MSVYRIRAVCNGIVLYGWTYSWYLAADKEYYICNPITNQWFSLPPAPKYLSKEVSVGFITQAEAGGTLVSFKVVLIHCPVKMQASLELEVFSSETGEWTAYSLKTDLPVFVRGCKSAVYLNNYLHWVGCRLGIIAYDPCNNPDKF